MTLAARGECMTRFARAIAEFASIPLLASLDGGGMLANSATATAAISMNHRYPSAAMTASAISAVVALPPRSGVRTFASFSTRATAVWMAAALLT
jgi:hypothetical protein